MGGWVCYCKEYKARAEAAEKLAADRYGQLDTEIHKGMEWCEKAEALEREVKRLRKVVDAAVAWRNTLLQACAFRSEQDLETAVEQYEREVKGDEPTTVR